MSTIASPTQKLRAGRVLNVLSPRTHDPRHQSVARHRPLALALAAALTACAMVVGVATTEAKPAGAGAGPPSGNKEGAKACQNSQNYVREDGSSFASNEECTAYTAQGDSLVLASVVEPCLNGGWQNLVRSDDTGFSSEEECRSYAAQGGTLQPKLTLLQQAYLVCRDSGATAWTTGTTAGVPHWDCQWIWNTSSGSDPDPDSSTTLASLASLCEQMPGSRGSVENQELGDYTIRQFTCHY